jgi:hypothetical protein
MTEDPSTWPNELAAWRTADEPEWRRQVYMLGWKARKNAAGAVVEYLLSGACPRCGHDLSVSAGVAGVLDSEGQAVETVRCNCVSATHAGRPDGKTGCGQRGNIPIP